MSSQETFISLLQLDPVPIETPLPLDRDKELPTLPEDLGRSQSTTTTPNTISRTSTTLTNSTTSTLGLNGSAGHGAIYYLSRIQRYSSYTFTVFATLHIATTSLIPLITQSVPAAESYLLQTRELYQTPLSEPFVVVLPIMAHVASGVAMRLIRRAHNLKRYGGATPAHKAAKHSGKNLGGEKEPVSHPPAHWSKLWPHLSYISVSGYSLLAFVSAHFFMNRILPLLVEGDSSNISLAYVAHGFARHRLISWLAYIGLIGAGAGHMVWGWAKWLGFSQRAGWKVDHITGHTEVDRQARKRRRRLFFIINGIAGGLAALWAAGGLGLVARSGRTDGWVGKIYDGLFEKVGM